MPAKNSPTRGESLHVWAKEPKSKQHNKYTPVRKIAKKVTAASGQTIWSGQRSPVLPHPEVIIIIAAQQVAWVLQNRSKELANTKVGFRYS